MFFVAFFIFPIIIFLWVVCGWFYPIDILKEYDFLSYKVLKGLLEYRDIIEPLVEKIMKTIEFQHE